MGGSHDGVVAIGIILGVLASMSGTAGKQCMRLSELQRRKGTPSAICAGRIAMACGLAFSAILGPLIDMGSYAFAPQSIIAPLGALDVVWNTLTAPFTLGETLTLRLSLGCCVIVAGALTSSLVGPHDPGDWDLEAMQKILLRPAVGYYLVAFTCWLVFNIVVLMPRSAAPPDKPWAPGNHVRGLSLGMTAGSIAGNMFCVKAFVEMCQASIRDGRPDYWTHWFPYGLFAGALMFAFSNLYFLTKAMREYEALFMGAVFEGSLIISACISGVVVFAELEFIALWQIAVYWAAIVGIVIGIWMVSCGSRSPQEKEEKAKDMDLECESKGACCAEDLVTNSKFSCTESISEIVSVEHLGANGLPILEPNDPELHAAKYAVIGKADKEFQTVPGPSSNVKSKDSCSDGCPSCYPRSAGSRASQVVSKDDALFSAVVPTANDSPNCSARNNNNIGVSCPDCTACLCGVSLDLVSGTKTWDVMSGLLVMSRTPQDTPGSDHPNPRNP
mmetsp:Transcript_60899/g.117373  ORF Transcript_60899/g.117373 Transcript_60899/m.117373 type:complete len:502 (-) Transcript_60899:223-1728(-)